MLGCLVAWGWRHLKVSQTVTLGILAFIGIYLVAMSPYFSIVDNTARVMYFAIPCALLVLISVYIEKAFEIKAGPISQFFGNISYGLYLIHVPVISAVGRGWYLLGLDKYLPVELMAILMGVGSIIAAYVLYVAVEKPSNKFFRQLSLKYLSRN